MIKSEPSIIKYIIIDIVDKILRLIVYILKQTVSSLIFFMLIHPECGGASSQAFLVYTLCIVFSDFYNFRLLFSFEKLYMLIYNFLIIPNIKYIFNK